MAALSPKLRSVQGGHAHWCPGCLHMHVIPSRWQFDGNVEAPTFSPSVRLYTRDEPGNRLETMCHYFITSGHILFCEDSPHALRGQTVDLPDIPTTETLGTAGAE